MKNLVTQRRLASKILKVGLNKIVFDKSKLEEIKEAVTKEDIRDLIDSKAIIPRQSKGISRVRARKRRSQKRRGRQKNIGSRKGKRGARLNSKVSWMNRIRSQRILIKELKDKNKISKETYRNLYNKCKGGFFRSKRHIRLYLEENNLLEKNGNK